MTAPRHPDGLDDYEGEELRQEIIRRARTEGLRIAYRSAIEVAADPKSPSQARTNAQRTIMTVAGVMDRKDRENEVEKDPSEMDGVELQEALERMLRGHAERERHSTRPRQADGLFD